MTNRGTARERWWRTRGQMFRFSPSATPTTEYDAAEFLLRSRVVDDSAAHLTGFLEHETELEPAWRDAALFGNTLTHLTIGEMEELGAQLFELLHAYQRQDPHSRPPDARRVRFIVYGLPEPQRLTRASRRDRP
jgi:hypothetical protein